MKSALGLLKMSLRLPAGLLAGGHEVAVAISFTVIFSSIASATDFNYQSYPLGERAAGMGGAYTALSNSPEGTFYNPAGIIHIDKDTISLSANIYHWTRGEAKNAISVAGTLANLPVKSMQIIPTSTAYIKRFRLPTERDDGEKKNAFAFSVYVPNYFAYAGDVSVSNADVNSTVSLQVSDSTILIGPSYARKMTDNFSFGFSLFYHLRSFNRELFYRAETATLFTQGYTDTEYSYGALEAVAGAKYKLPHNLSLGLSVRPYTLKINSSGKLYSSSVVIENNVPQSTQELVSRNVRTNLATPIRITTGIAYEKPIKYALSGDISFYLPHKFTSAHDNTGTFSDIKIDQNFVVNGNVGGEYYIGGKFPLRLGAFTNLSSTPDAEAGTAATSKIDYYGGTFSLGYEMGHTTYNIGAQYAYGVGKLLDSGGVAQDFNIYTVTALLSGSYRF
ncbi:MAG: hypothetical protein HYY43_05165 [Deltaproteobacteria bacterium]|nr:hypothetical protein [Deltaproteobacteria bacterium]